MILRTLGYYDDFVCIGGACKNSCCIGWELDIDEATCDYYRSLPGPFGDRLRAHMAAGSFRDEDCHTFCLTVDGRCPLLNADGLCDIVLTLGPEALCEICSEYPRYTFELGEAVEKSLTISCEEAARLMFTRTRPLLITESPLDPKEDASADAPDGDFGTAAVPDDAPDDGLDSASAPEEEFISDDEENGDISAEITLLRARLISILQDRTSPLCARVIRAIRLTDKAQTLINEAELSAAPLADSLKELFREEAEHSRLCPSGNPEHDRQESAAAANQAQYRPDPVSPAEGLSARLALLAGCEVLSHEWTEAVDRVRAAFSRQEPDWAAFMEQLYYPRQVDYEHLLVYFLFRYMPRAAYDFDAAGKMAFAVFATLVVRDLDWAVFVENGGHFSITDRIRTAGIVSREIEHSDYNLDTLFEDIAFDENFHAEGLIRQL